MGSLLYSRTLKLDGVDSIYQDDLGMHRALREPNILQYVLIKLRESVTASGFLPCIQVCKVWNDIGTPILEAAIVLSEATIVQFLRPIRRKPLRIRSLTLRLSTSYRAFYAMPGSTRVPAIDVVLQSLSHVIDREMKSLHTFSFMIEHSVHPGKQNDDSKPYLGYRPIVQLLEALPVTCKNLEIDTGGIETYTRDSHLCSSIIRFAPRAEHMRLRLGRICRNFIWPTSLAFSSPSPLAPKLKTLAVNMGRDNRWEAPSVCSNNFTWDGLSRFLKDCLSHSFYFPRIQEMKVYTADRKPLFQQRRIFCDDIIRSPGGKVRQKFIFEQEIDRGENPPLRCLHNQDLVFILGHDISSRDHYEEAWVTTAIGARLPKPESDYLDLPDDLLGCALQQDLARPPAPHFTLSPVVWKDYRPKKEYNEPDDYYN